METFGNVAFYAIVVIGIGGAVLAGWGTIVKTNEALRKLFDEFHLF